MINKIDKIWRELVTIEYVLVQGYSDDVKKDQKRLNELRFLHDRLLKINKLLGKNETYRQR